MVGKAALSTYMAWVDVRHLAEEFVGFGEIDDGLWEVYFGPAKLGRSHEREAKI